MVKVMDFFAFIAGDFEDVNCIVIFVGPGRDLRGVTTVGFEDVSCEIAEDDVFPCDEEQKPTPPKSADRSRSRGKT